MKAISIKLLAAAFVAGAGFAGDAVAGSLDQILDWSTADGMHFGALAAASDGTNYLELSTSTYDAALTLANTQVAAGTNLYVVVQVGSDTVVFVDTDGDHDIDDAVVLVGRTLADIAAANII